MKINVFGLGYVGCVSSACLAKDGHDVTGIDVDKLKVDMINDGKSPIVEPGLQDVIEKAVSAKNLKAASENSGIADISIICVGTPSKENGSLQLQYINRVFEQIGEYLKKIDSYHVVNLRSTVLPGTVKEIVIPILEKNSKKKAGVDFGICMNPEFMREGTSIHDYYNPPFTIIGELDQKSGDIIEGLYSGINAPVIRMDIKEAEMVKYACNTLHALKVTFANEIGNICKAQNIDGYKVMSTICKDTKLNISPYYFKPGFAFGGSCLPKDVRALLYRAKELDVESPLLSSILKSNENQIDIAYRLIKRTRKKKIGILGLSFKPKTDDLRESPMVELIEKLLGKGYEVFIYDAEVSLAKIFGSNKKYIEMMVPHISCLIKEDIQEVITNSDVIVVAKNDEDYKKNINQIKEKKIVLDLVRMDIDKEGADSLYEGICW